MQSFLSFTLYIVSSSPPSPFPLSAVLLVLLCGTRSSRCWFIRAPGAGLARLRFQRRLRSGVGFVAGPGRPGCAPSGSCCAAPAPRLHLCPPRPSPLVRVNDAAFRRRGGACAEPLAARGDWWVRRTAARGRARPRAPRCAARAGSLWAGGARRPTSARRRQVRSGRAGSGAGGR